jgi:hypothetical protein
MGRPPVKKWFLFVVMAYLALATMGTFTFMSLDVPYFESRADKRQAQDVFLISVTPPVECLAISAAKGHSFFPPRQCLPRTVIPPGILAAGSGLLCAAVMSIAGNVAHNKKSTILLKLRI